MWNHISTELWMCIIIHFSITVAVKPNAITNFGRYKRSFGFGFSNPIFSRVFNPHDSRSLAAKFFGNDYGTQYTTNIGHSQYHYNAWSHDSWSDDNSNFKENGREKSPHVHKYGERRNLIGNSKSQLEPSYEITSKTFKDIRTAEKGKLGHVKSMEEHVFKLLPLYDIKKSFRTSTEIKKLRENENFVKPKEMTVKTSSMEYIFNLLPHYEIRNVFRNFTSNVAISGGSKSTTKIAGDISPKTVINPLVSGGLKWPIGILVQPSDLNNNTVHQETITNTLKTRDFEHLSSHSKESELKLHLPNASIEEILRSNPKESLLLDSTPSILFQESENKTPAPSHEEETNHFESKLDIIPNSSDHKRNDSLENVIQTNEKSTHPVKIAEILFKENFEHTNNNTNAIQKSSIYIPHRTKNQKSYSQFLSLPAVVIYQPFNNENTPAIPTESVNKSDNFTKDSSRFQNVRPKLHDSNFVTFGDSFFLNNGKKQFQIYKTEPFTQRTSVEFKSTNKSLMNISDISATNVSIPVAQRFQSYLHSTEVDIEESVKDEHPFEKKGNCINCNSNLILNSTNSRKTFFPTNGSVANIRNKFKPNIPNSIMQVVLTPFKEEPDKHVKHITRPVTVKPLRGDMPEIISLLPEYMINDKAKFVHRLAPERTLPKFERNRRRKLKQNSVLSPANSEDSKYLKVHHVQRKPPTFNITSTQLNTTRDRDSNDQIVPHTDNAFSRTPSMKEKATNIPHKRLRFDAKRLPTEKKLISGTNHIMSIKVYISIENWCTKLLATEIIN
ncbi:hypothetical protein WA026_005317 [Henosepilachna vigintioctopunctata]|uniref:Uncharacterized protein n=1 Tax=Henosepilachna vigintioctopunctata TaxID=420089 RepID=A0AAW1UT94_9CUCU